MSQEPVVFVSPPMPTIPMQEGGICYPPFGAEPGSLIAIPRQQYESALAAGELPELIKAAQKARMTQP